MEERQVKLFYKEMQNTFCKTDSDWTDKGAQFRTLLENFFKIQTNQLDQATNLCDRINAYYDKHPEEEAMREPAHQIRKQTNDSVHNRITINASTVKKVILTKDDIHKIYENLVLVVFNATRVFPDDITFKLLGTDKNDYLSSLNEQQKVAVLKQSRIVFVNSGPGTGKTTLLVQKLVHYIKNNQQRNNIVALSYTNTAAQQLESKFQQKAFEFLKDCSFELFNGTIHSYCLRKLRKYNSNKGVEFNYTIITDDELNDLTFDLREQLKDSYTIEQIKEYIDKGSRTWPEDFVQAVDAIKKKYRYITLNDILSLFYDQLQNNGEFAEWILSTVDFLVIDEAQDLNRQNYEIFELMLQKKPSLELFLVGDPRQNIFEFNGGSYKYLDNFLKNHSSEVSVCDLSFTYRCPSKVVDLVNTFNFIDCVNTPLQSNKQGDIIPKKTTDPSAESQYVVDCIKGINDYDTCAVLSPNIKGLSSIIDKLNSEKIPFVVYGGRRKLKIHINFINNLLRILQSKNEKSIYSVAKLLNIDVKTQPIGAPRHFMPIEIFNRTPFGRKLRSIYNDYVRLEWDLGTLVEKIIDELLPKEIYEDTKALSELNIFKSKIECYRSIKEYLDAFPVYKERFVSLYEKDFSDCITSTDGAYVTLSTIHSAKGLEWKHVYLIGMYDSNFPGIKQHSTPITEKQERYLNIKRRELYVACTRASECLTITYPESIDRETQTPSRLLSGINFDN